MGDALRVSGSLPTTEDWAAITESWWTRLALLAGTTLNKHLLQFYNLNNLGHLPYLGLSHNVLKREA